MFLKEKSISVDGTSGDVIIKVQGPEKIIEHIRKGSISIDGTYLYTEESKEIEHALDVCDQVAFGTQDLSKVDIHTLLASDKVTLSL